MYIRILFTTAAIVLLKHASADGNGTVEDIYSIDNKTEETPTVEEIDSTEGRFLFFVQILVTLKSFNGTSNETKEIKRCGGSLIRPRWILTVAHCFTANHVVTSEMFDKNLVTAIINTAIAPIEQAYIPAYYVHEHVKNQYGKTSLRIENDISVALIEKSFMLPDTVKPITLHDTSIGLCRKGMVICAIETNNSQEPSKTVKSFAVFVKGLSELSAPPEIQDENVFYSETPLSQVLLNKSDEGGPFVCSSSDIIVQYGVIAHGTRVPDKEIMIYSYEPVEKHLGFIMGYINPKLKPESVGYGPYSAYGTNGASVLTKLPYVLICFTVVRCINILLKTAMFVIYQ